MILSLATGDDLDAVVALEQGFLERERWSAASWAGELSASDRRAWLARVDGEVVAVALFQASGDTADLHRVVVAPSARRRGVAAALLDAGHAWARDCGATRVLLEVRPDNQAAVALYQRLGYTRIALRRDYYATGVDAWVMQHEFGVSSATMTEGVA